MTATGERIFMPVYGELEYDGRVQRAADALGESHNVVVFSIRSGPSSTYPKFSSQVAAIPTSLVRTRFIRGPLCLFFWLLFLGAAVRARPSLIYAHDFFLAFPGWIAAYLTRAKFVYDAHELIVRHDVKSHNQVNGLWYRMEKWAVRKADLVIAANQERSEIMQSHYGLKAAPLVIRNIPPLPAAQWDEQETLREYPQLARRGPRAVRLVYQGDINLKRGIGKFLAAMSHLPDDYELLLVGGGVDLGKLQEEAKTRVVGHRVTFLGRVPNHHLPSILKLCDVGLISYGKTGMNNLYCAPNKVYEYLQADLPIVASCQPSLRSIVEGFGVGEVIDCAPDEDEAKVSEETAAAIQRVAAVRQGYVNRISAVLEKNNWEAERGALVQAIDGLS